MTRSLRFLVPALLAWGAASTAAFAGMAAVRGLGDLTAVVLIALAALVVGAILVGGVRTVILVAVFPFLSRRQDARLPEHTDVASRVALLYCTANDFSPQALDRSRLQTHVDVTTIILDDSSDEVTQRRIDRYAAATGAEVVRREIRTGYKAGNLNHFLATDRADDFDHFAIVDADEILEPTFVTRALDWFAADPTTGVVQGRHRAHEGGTPFSAEFGAMLETHVRVTQLARSTFGFSMFMGRGALISAACVRDAGGFPELVTEDVAFSLEARLAGYRIAYAPDIVSSEDYPIDYHAFKKQHGKFVEGAVELLRVYGRSIVMSRLTAAEKVDLLLEHSMVPLGALLGVLLFALGLLPGGQSGLLPAWIGACLAVSGVTALVPETLRRLVRRGPLAAGLFLGRALALYASTLWVTLRSTARVVAGRRAVFTITPKRRSTSGWRATVAAELVVLVVAIALGLVVAGSVLPAATAAGAAAAAVYLTRFSAVGAAGVVRLPGGRRRPAPAPPAALPPAVPAPTQPLAVVA